LLMETHAIVIADPTCVIRMLKGGRQTASISKRSFLRHLDACLSGGIKKPSRGRAPWRAE
jgi:hypothetical protein